MVKEQNGEKHSNRYSLIIETKNGNKYYYDVKASKFIKLEEYSKPTKTYLQAIDVLTLSYENEESFAKEYGIDEEIKSVYITYHAMKIEKRLKPVFNNNILKEMASNCLSNQIDWNIKLNQNIFNEIYNEIMNPNSEFAEIIIEENNRNRPYIKPLPETRNLISSILANEEANKDHEKYGAIMDDTYYDDKEGYRKDLKNELSQYKELRNLYYDLCKYKAITAENIKQEGEIEETKEERKSLALEPQQISFFNKWKIEDFMMTKKQIYYLIKEDRINKTIEYLDPNTLKFSEARPKPVSLDTIDMITSIFINGQELESWDTKSYNYDSENGYSYYIYDKIKQEKVPIIWNDSIYRSIIAFFRDKISFEGTDQKEAIDTILERIKKEKELQEEIAKKGKSYYGLSQKSITTVKKAIERDNEKYDEYFINNFSDFNEFRALYIIVKYKTEQEKKRKDVKMKEKVPED